jgi:type IV secretion system protein VirD4
MPTWKIDALALWYGLATVGFVVGCWFILKFLMTRTLKFIGVWNPFRRMNVSRSWVLRWCVRMGERAEASHFGERSTGGWASMWEVMSWRFQRGDIFLGRPRGMLRPIGIPTEKHMVTIAHAGAYKTTGALIPNLLVHEGSALIIDPVGELARITAARRGPGGQGVKGMRQAVHVLDPFGLTGMETAVYNVFDEMEHIARGNPDGPVSYAAKISEAMVEVRPGPSDYWDKDARRFLLALILYVYIGPEEKRNLVTMRRLLMEGDPEALERYIASGEATRKNTPFQALLIAMLNCPPGPYRDAVAGSAASFMAMGDNQKGGVVTTAQEQTSFLDMPEIVRVSKGSSFRLADLKDTRMSVYVCVPISMVSGVVGRWLRMFVMLLTDMMSRVSHAPDPPILMAIDEFPHLHLSSDTGVDSLAPLMRKYGVRLWVVGQGIEQFKAVYPDTWQDFIGNAEAVQFMGVKDQSTVQTIVSFLGEHPVRDRRTGVVDDRNLLDANQVSQLLFKGGKNQIIWRGDRRPMILKVTPYFEYLPYWYYAPDPRYPEKLKRSFWRLGRKPRPLQLPAQRPEARAALPAKMEVPVLSEPGVKPDWRKGPAKMVMPVVDTETLQVKRQQRTPSEIMAATEGEGLDFGADPVPVKKKMGLHEIPSLLAKPTRNGLAAYAAGVPDFWRKGLQPEEMMEILLRMCDAGGFTLTDAAMEKAARRFIEMPEKLRRGVMVETLLKKADASLKKRVGYPRVDEEPDENPIDAGDIPEKM